MSFFFDFCFVAFLLWLVIFVASLFLLDGDWSLIFYAKFGKKIRKFAFLSKIQNLTSEKTKKKILLLSCKKFVKTQFLGVVEFPSIF